MEKTKFDVNWQVWLEDTKGGKHYLCAFLHKEHAEGFWTSKIPHNIKMRNDIFDEFTGKGITIKRVFVEEDFHY